MLSRAVLCSTTCLEVIVCSFSHAGTGLFINRCSYLGFIFRHASPMHVEGVLTSSPSWSALACMSVSSLRMSDSSAMAVGGMRCSPLNGKCSSYLKAGKEMKKCFVLGYAKEHKASISDRSGTATHKKVIVEWTNRIYKWLTQCRALHVHLCISFYFHLKTIIEQALHGSQYI